MLKKKNLAKTIDRPFEYDKHIVCVLSVSKDPKVSRIFGMGKDYG